MNVNCGVFPQNNANMHRKILLLEGLNMRVGLVGLGSMGSVHLSNYRKMKKKNEGAELVAVCDVDGKKLSAGKATEGNLGMVSGALDLSGLAVYTDMEEMIRKENLDYVDLCLPTFLHAPFSVKAMEMGGVNVFCEKPMALTSEQCTEMIAAAKRTGKVLMIGHTLRYWKAYTFAKDYVDRSVFGKCTGAYFYRGGSTPMWSWENWLLQKDKSGGALLDQHIHDVDTINWMFGLPKAVTTLARVHFEGSGYDIVSTNYLYDDMVINAQDDWTIHGHGYGFSMLFRMNFEKGALVFENGKLNVYPEDGDRFTPDFSDANAYYDELILYSELLKDSSKFDYMALLESHRDTIRLAEAEQRSADNKGTPVYL
jgi:predicted dehydrogenase